MILTHSERESGGQNFNQEAVEYELKKDEMSRRKKKIGIELDGLFKNSNKLKFTRVGIVSGMSLICG